MTVRRLLDNFLALNRRACERLARLLPHTRVDVFRLYEVTVARRIAVRPGQLVVDIGAGRDCPYAAHVAPAHRPVIIGVDLSVEAMDGNDSLDEKLVADLRDGLPLSDGTADIVTSRSVLEHLSCIERVLTDCARVLRPGGYVVHLLSGGLAPFALVNRMLPEKISSQVLYAVHPTSRGAGGQPTVYDHCNFRSLRKVLGRNGYDMVDIYANFGSDYLYFFVPLFLLESLYLMTLRALRLKSLAVSYLVVARRGRSSSQEIW